jgi:hypothetical protein
VTGPTFTLAPGLRPSEQAPERLSEGVKLGMCRAALTEVVERLNSERSPEGARWSKRVRDEWISAMVLKTLGETK